MHAIVRAVLLGALFVATDLAAQGAAPAPLASQDTNWNGVVADLTEFKRKGSTLSVKVKLRNTGTESVTVDLGYSGSYVLDADNGKKYEVLRDDQDQVIAATHTYGDRYYKSIDAGAATTVWIKFPAPPPETKAATLTLTGMPPFDDVAIQDQ